MLPGTSGRCKKDTVFQSSTAHAQLSRRSVLFFSTVFFNALAKGEIFFATRKHIFKYAHVYYTCVKKFTFINE